MGGLGNPERAPSQMEQGCAGGEEGGKLQVREGKKWKVSDGREGGKKSQAPEYTDGRGKNKWRLAEA